MERIYDFDRIVDRRGTDCLKFDFAPEFGKRADVIPMWVADMDFPAPDGVLEVLHGCVTHGVFGYSDAKPDYFDAVSGWFKRRFDWTVEPEWLVRTPGVVYALAMAVRALTRPGDAVLIQPPVYHPFFDVVKNNGRTLAECPLRSTDGRYDIDFDALDKAFETSGAKLMILCSPHNPVGRVWTADELQRIGGICKKHGAYVISDEIHCDFTWSEHPHTPFLKAAPDMRDRAIVCTAPSKTFNLAGLQASNVFIPDEALRERFRREIAASGYSQLNVLGLEACKAAYTTGEAWLEQLLDYLRANREYMREYLGKNLPMLKMTEAEGTYLAWVDFRALGLTHEALDKLISEDAGLWLSDGVGYGACGEGFMRVVLACPRKTLETALHKLKAAVDALQK